MKKKTGYTLAEVLISLAVVGLIAAVLMPLVNKYRPDTTKVRYLKTYDSLITVINTLSSSSNFYEVQDGQDDAPFLNVGKVSVGDDELGGDKEKLCELIGAFFSDDVSCKDGEGNTRDYISVDDYKDNEDFEPNFRAKNGVEFFLTTNEFKNAENVLTGIQTDIYFDINGSKGKNCMYNENTCPKPDRFLLKVVETGQVNIEDPVGRFYHDTRMNWKLRDIPANYVPTELACTDLEEDCECGDYINQDGNLLQINCLSYVPSDNRYLLKTKGAMTVASDVTATVQFFKKINNTKVSNPVSVTIDKYNNKSEASEGLSLNLFSGSYNEYQNKVLKDNPNDYVLKIEIESQPDNKYIYVGANNFQIDRDD